jgi:short-subunit dehydrogenase
VPLRASAGSSQKSYRTTAKASVWPRVDVELFVLNAGIGFVNPQLDWKRERDTIDVNVSGFVAMANVAAEYLQARGSGHIVSVSSIAALRGNRAALAYAASKAFMSNCMEALRNRFRKLKAADCRHGCAAWICRYGHSQG